MVYDDFQFLKFDRPDEGVLLITLNRPEVMNATNARLHWELTKIWGVVQNDPPHRIHVKGRKSSAQPQRRSKLIRIDGEYCEEFDEIVVSLWYLELGCE
jgi:hypothetical protein